MLMMDPETVVSITNDLRRERLAAARQPITTHQNVRRTTGRALVRAGAWLLGPNQTA